MRNPIEVLNTLSEKSKDPSYRFERLYRNLYNPEFYMLAYMKIYSNDGSMTQGINGVTIDGMSEKRIERLISSLKDCSYQPNPARRTYIAKKGNAKKKRPLGIPSGDDKLVQEIVRMILESIYEPAFSKASHGFRPKKSCHTALLNIKTTFTGVKWFVEGDIQACFDSFDHHIIIKLLRQRINDEKFINLMWKFLKAGYIDQWTYHKTYTGVPQGSGMSPILSNIYLNEIDKYMAEYKATFDKPKRTANPEHKNLGYKICTIKKKNDKIWDSLTVEEKIERAKELRYMRSEQRKLPTRPFREDSFKSLQYVRYADDFIVGVIGSKEDAEHVKRDLSEFLRDELKLNLSEEKTTVTHSGKRARFLGFDITVSRNQNIKRQKGRGGSRRRTYNGVVMIFVPHEKWAGKLLELSAIRIVKDKITGEEHWKAIHRGKLMNLADIQILSKVNAEVRGFYNYYSIACNASTLNHFSGLMKYSMLKTFGAKYRMQVKKVKERYFKNGNFTVSYDTRSGTKEAVYYNQGFRQKKVAMYGQVDIIDNFKRYDKPNSLAARLRAKKCELCQKDCDNIEMHQVKKLKDLKGQSDWEIIMRKRRRKTLAVCHECHASIHDNDIIVS